MRHYAKFVAKLIAEGQLPPKQLGIPANPVLPPPAAKAPKPKKRGLYKSPPAAPGSPRDIAEKERAKRAEKQRRGEMRNRNPFGDSLIKEINKMIQG